MVTFEAWQEGQNSTDVCAKSSSNCEAERQAHIVTLRFLADIWTGALAIRWKLFYALLSAVVTVDHKASIIAHPTAMAEVG